MAIGECPECEEYLGRELAEHYMDTDEQDYDFLCENCGYTFSVSVEIEPIFYTFHKEINE